MTETAYSIRRRREAEGLARLDAVAEAERAYREEHGEVIILDPARVRYPVIAEYVGPEPEDGWGDLDPEW